MKGLVDAQQEGRKRGMRVNNIILASPDIDLFKTELAQLSEQVIERIYLLISPDDAALRFSRRLAGRVPRVGAADGEELGKLGVKVIDLSQIED